MSEDADIKDLLENMNTRLEKMERFVARRFDEISMEVNATSQLIHMAEEDTEKRFGEILQTMHAISHSGTGDTAVNAGVELEAVIEDTESAANTILDAADRIVDLIRHKEQFETTEDRDDALAKINGDIQEILMACTFQDLTGQRIRKTLENLSMIEERLSSTLEKVGLKVDVTKESEEIIREHSKLVSQDDIDALFATK